MIKGLLGRHLSHSYSKLIHENLCDYTYELIELEPDQIEEFLRAKQYDALNVTIPYKQAVMSCLDEIDIKAKQIQAVNTIVNCNGKLVGYNTDYYGFQYTLVHHKIDVKNKKIVVLGNGGASKAVAVVLQDMGAREIIFVKRNISDQTITYETCYESHNDADVIVNCSPVGMFPNIAESPIDLTKFQKLSAVVDLIYNPNRTQLLAQAQLLGIKIAGGLLMLVAQAVKAIEYFNGTKIDERTLIQLATQMELEKNNLVLIGMPGCGKSSVARELARQLNMQHIDTDELIVKHIQMSIKEYFNMYGESAFRQVESKIIQEVSSHQNCIISCGGGVVKNQQNIVELMKNGIIIYVNRPYEKLVMSSDRPLSQNSQQLQALYKERLPLYKKYGEKEVINDSSIMEAVNQCIKIKKGEN